MSSETIFIILGLGLTALALIVSFLGLRMEGFPPSRGALLGGVAVFVAVVGATATFAWDSAEEEQTLRDEERAAGELPYPSEIMAGMAAGAQEQAAEAAGEAPAGGEPPAGAPETASADGAALFDSQGCAGCHALAAAGSTGAIGPDLDTSPGGADLAFIEESIVDPDAALAKGFEGGIMPANFGEVLSPEELDALVQFIADGVGAKQ